MTKETTPDGSQELAHLFRYTSRLLARAYHGRRHGSHGGHARHAQGKVLSIIGESGPISQGDLLNLLDVRSSSLSELLAKLERNGLVKRERNEADRRSFIVSATEAADALLAAREEGGQDIAESLFSCLDSEEKAALQAILRKLVASLKGGSGVDGCPGQGPHGRGRGRGFKGGMKGRGPFSGGRGGRRR